ncbi:MAG: FecR domain-containing protein [Deltaproteobacteria bacterium]|nr:FecR domain-containing protein [Deltaproteobacteria bacterium]
MPSDRYTKFLQNVFLILCIIVISSPFVFANESSVVKALSGDVYLLSYINRWERVYEQEKLSSGFRIKSEKGSSATIVISGEAMVSLGENTLLELNENFSDRSGVISLALFYGTAEFSIKTPEKKIRVITPRHIFICPKGKFRISLDSKHNSLAEVSEGKLFHLSDGKEVLLSSLSELTAGRTLSISDYTDCIKKNMEELKEAIESFGRISSEFENLAEKKLSSKRTEPSLMKDIERSISDVFTLILKMSEAKNRINMFAIFLKNETDENNLSDSEEEENISDALDELRKRQQEINEIKKRYNNIIASELLTIFKTYDTLKNGKKKK